jgi:trigger factor
MDTLEKSLPAKIKVLKEEPCEMTFSIELPKEEVAKETESVFGDIQRRAALPGFRAGKAPIELIKQNFAERARKTVVENLVGRLAAQVIRERKIQTIDTPRIEKLEFEPGKQLNFHMKVEKDPDIKAKDYKGIKISKKDSKVTDEILNKAIAELQERNATLVASQALKVEKTHFVVIDFEGKIDEKTFPGGSAKNYLIDMSTPQTIPGFSDGILGAAVNESRSVTVTFPADYPKKEFSGKPAVFGITVKEIKEKKLPALDDDFAKDLGLTSFAELQQKVRESLLRDLQAKSDKDVEDQIFQALLEHNSFSVPHALVEDRVRTLIQRAKQSLQRQGLMAPDDPKADEVLHEKVHPQAEKDVRLSYLLKAISSQEKLDASEADFEEMKKKALAESKDTKTVENYFNEHYLSIKASLTEGKVMDFLKNQAKIKMVEA